jgi:tetratricopeptide (TPR) repeat protein
LQFSLAFFLTTTGRVDEGARLAEMMVREHPDDCRSHHVLALAAVLQQQPGKAIDEIRQVMALAPGYDPSWKSLAPFLIEQGNPDATIDLIRQALAAAPFCPELRFALGSALMQKNQDVEAAAQLRYACLLMPQPANTLATLAWKLATAPNPAERNGAVAVRLAEEACALHVDHQTIHMLILAAAYAEAARYPEAVKTAEQAHLSAVTSRDFTGAALTQQLIELFKTAQPYRDIRPQ